jgi:hypothetical protein
MKKSIFDMAFVLPPLVVMTEVEKNIPAHTGFQNLCSLAKLGDHCI